MTVLSRLLIAAVVAYILIGVVYATSQAVYYEFFAKNPGALAAPWESPVAFLVWWVVPVGVWPWNVVILRGVPGLLVASVYLATVGFFYLAASRRSAPRRLKSRYPNTH